MVINYVPWCCHQVAYQMSRGMQLTSCIIRLIGVDPKLNAIIGIPSAIFINCRAQTVGRSIDKASLLHHTNQPPKELPFKFYFAKPTAFQIAYAVSIDH